MNISKYIFAAAELLNDLFNFLKAIIFYEIKIGSEKFMMYQCLGYILGFSLFTYITIKIIGAII